MKLEQLFEDLLNYNIFNQLQKDIKKAAMNPDIHVERAVELVQRVYKFNGVEIPVSLADKGYNQYQTLCVFAVKQLNAATLKGVRDDAWRFARENI